MATGNKGNESLLDKKKKRKKKYKKVLLAENRKYPVGTLCFSNL
jgi:hypothetical protein